MQGIATVIGTTGVPIITENVCAYLEGRIIGSLDCGTHTLFLGEVVDSGILSDATPMTYAHYHLVKKGRSPKTAPTYTG